MAAPRKGLELSIGDEDLARLQVIARSRSEAASRVERARILLGYRADGSSYSVGVSVGVTHQTVQRCVARARKFGVLAALDDSPRPGNVGPGPERGEADLEGVDGQDVHAREE